MKTTAIIIFIFGLSNYATAQYAHIPKNDTGIYTAETTIGDKMTIVLNSYKNNFTVDYQLVEEFSKAVVIVKESIGKVIVMEELHYDIDQIIISSENWPSGQYSVSVLADGKTIMHKTITLIK